MKAVLCLAYATAMLVANLTIAAFGPVVAPINAFFLIGLDLALRDWLNERLDALHMATLIGVTGVLTFVLNPAAGRIALASTVAFVVAALVDWWVFNRAQGTFLGRSLRSNIAGAAVDSLLFPTIAFGALAPVIVLAQFGAKAAGGTFWAWVVARIRSA